MENNKDRGEFFMMGGLFIGIAVGMLLNPGGYTLIANIAMAFVGGLIGGFIGLAVGHIFAALKPDSGE